MGLLKEGGYVTTDGIKEGESISVIPEYVIKNESRMFSAVNTNLGAIGLEGQNAEFYAASPLPTIVSNVHNPIGYVIPAPGRIAIIRSISVFTTSDAFVQLYLHKFAKTIAGEGKILVDGMQLSKVQHQKDNTGDTIEWDFKKDPLILMPGERIIITYWKSGAVGVNWMINRDADDITADLNYGAEKTMLVLGDSIGVTGEETALVPNLWTFNIRDRYKAAGHDIRLCNICQGGTNTDQWDWWVKQGKIDNIKADILFISLGMNDSSSAAGLTIGGTGFTKTGIKNIVKRYLFNNPGGKIIVNNIPPTDKTDRQTYIGSYRAEIAQTVSELQSEGIAVYFADISTAYSTSNGSAFLPTEQSAGSRLHPNSTVGQPAIANIIWSVCQNLLN